MDPRWAAYIKADRRINLDDLWKLLVMTFMNILWKVENVIINFYIRKWGRKIKQTALNIEHGPHVKRIVSRIMGELTEERGRNEKRDDNPSSWIFLLLCRDGKVKSVCLMTIRVEARDHYGRLVSVGVCVCVWFKIKASKMFYIQCASSWH